MLPARSIVAALLGPPLLAACFGGEIPPDRSADTEARIAQRLAGRVAGVAVDCLPYSTSGDMEVLDRDTLLFDSGRTIYRQDASGYCYPTRNQGGYALVTTGVASAGRLCDGDIARVVSTTGGFIAGSCTFNRFVPYRKP